MSSSSADNIFQKNWLKIWLLIPFSAKLYWHVSPFWLRNISMKFNLTVKKIFSHHVCNYLIFRISFLLSCLKFHVTFQAFGWNVVNCIGPIKWNLLVLLSLRKNLPSHFWKLIIEWFLISEWGFCLHCSFTM